MEIISFQALNFKAAKTLDFKDCPALRESAYLDIPVINVFLSPILELLGYKRYFEIGQLPKCVALQKTSVPYNARRVRIFPWWDFPPGIGDAFFLLGVLGWFCGILKALHHQAQGC